MTLSPGTEETLLGFRVERILATDGVVDILLGRAVDFSGAGTILKVVRMLDPDPRLALNFEREATAYTKLRHPNIVQLIRFGATSRQVAMAFEYVDGFSLEYARSKAPPFDDAAAMFIGREIFSALGAAHSARNAETGTPAPITHRDLNPLNVFLSKQGEVKVADFGMTKVGVVRSQGGDAEESLHYLAPEQIRGEPLSARVDIYAATLILSELLAANRSTPADGGETPRAFDDVRSDLPAELRAMIARGLQRDPERRDLEPEEAVFILDSHNPQAKGKASLLEAVQQIVARPRSTSGPPEGVQPSAPPAQPQHAGGTPPIAGAPAAPNIRFQVSVPPKALDWLPPPLPGLRARASVPPLFSFPPPESYLPELASLPPFPAQRPFGQDLVEASVPSAPPTEPLGFNPAPPEPPAPQGSAANPPPYAPGAPPPKFEPTPLGAHQVPPNLQGATPTRRSGALLALALSGIAVLTLGGAAFAFRGPILALVGAKPAVSTTPAKVAAKSENTVESTRPSLTAEARPKPSVEVDAAGSASAAPRASSTPPSVAPTASAVPSAVPSSVPSAAVVASSSARAQVPPPDLAPTDGIVRMPPRARGHRVFLDGKLAGDGIKEVRVRCGTHVLKIGSQGASETIEVPCGEELALK